MDVKMDSPQYGPNGSEYLTPFLYTVLYDSTRPVEVAIAHLCPRSQLLDISGGGHNFAYIPEHPTPEVFICNDTLPLIELEQFFDRGTSVIRVLIEGDKKYLDATKPVIEFPFEKLFRNVELESGLIGVYMTEYMRAAGDSLRQPSKSKVLAEITPTRAQDFLRYVSQSGQELDEVIKDICGSSKGFDMLEAGITTGATIRMKDILKAKKQISRGLTLKIGEYDMLVVQMYDLTTEIIECISKDRPESAHVLLYEFEPIENSTESKIYPGWRIILHAADAMTKLQKMLPDGRITGESTHATVWIPTGWAQKLLPHLYPME